jgi:protein ImuA
VLVETKDLSALLRAAGDSARCAGLGALIVEAKGKAADLDLTVSRRLSLAAERSGVTVLLVRNEAVPTPSAAATRWRVAAAPSKSPGEGAPGQPAFIIELLRRRGGPLS